ncbi:DUF6266 family protein [Pedobacter sp.]|jgi:hypothetical protein|uniref:DUF6266 family protein n=1 Tax=Pedobacter sp. TaxID=1411316 RepID=UPI002C7D06E4|nr:DUF6266 family protein [Pedobacter sp.]HWW40462.1 DUF6266 family protein [Pedobacter sp.]
MARIPRGIMGPIIGKLGPLVGATWKEKAYVRARPSKNKKKGTKSPAKYAAEQTFRFMHLWLVPFHDYIMIGFMNVAREMTQINAAFSRNFKAALTGVYPDLGIDYSKVVISTGDLPGLRILQCRIENGVLEVSWEDHQFDKAWYDDQVMLVIYEASLHVTDGFVGRASRSDGQFKFPLKDDLVGKTLHIYIGMVSLNRELISESQYLGTVQS